MDRDAVDRAAAALAAARFASGPVPDLAAGIRPQTEAAAYEVQAALSRDLTAAGQGPLAGWKIGATTPGMQRYLGVDGPAYGRILAGNVHATGATLPRSGFCKPGIECEIAVRIGSVAAGGGWTRDSVAELIDAVLPAIEIVENRYGDFLARGTPTLIADDFFHKACVLGADAGDWRGLDLAGIAGRTLVDGAPRGAGTGADVMGHPLEAVAWLANALAADGRTLAPGQIVLTGSVAPVIWLEDFPASAAIEFDGLGSVAVTFA